MSLYLWDCQKSRNEINMITQYGWSPFVICCLADLLLSWLFPKREPHTTTTSQMRSQRKKNTKNFFHFLCGGGGEEGCANKCLFNKLGK